MALQAELRAGGIDWLAVWRQMYDTEREQGEAVTLPEAARPQDQWANRAKRFAAVGERMPQPDGFMQLLLPRLRPTDTVLDVGAGAGRYVPILARHAARVIALEPSPAMREYLAQRIADEQLTNVEIVAETWPTASPPQADVVISAHVLYAVRDIAPFLHAMHAAATRTCYLPMMIRHVNSLFSPFWERIHGQPRLPLPAGLEAFNALHQLGYPANLEMVQNIRAFNFLDTDEALSDIRQRLRLAPNAQQDAVLTEAIAELLIHNPDGSLSLPDAQRPSALIWWDVT